MLQLADELDDAIGGVRQWWLGAAPYLELPLIALFGIGVFAVAILLGAGPTTVAAAATGLSVCAAFSLRRRFKRYTSP